MKNYYSTRLFYVFILSILYSILPAQITLPYAEGFENSGTITTFTSDTNNLFTTSGGVVWSYEKTIDGRLRLEAGNGFYNSGSRAVTLDQNPSGAMSINYLIATIPLQNYALSTYLELSFFYSHHGDENNVNDKVWIRGSNTSPWIIVYDLYINREIAGVYKHVTSIDIDSILSVANQSIDSTFQIRFGQEDNFPATSTISSDGFSFDDISITENLPISIDASISTINSPNSPVSIGANAIKVTIKNNGFDTLQSATINYSLNGVTHSPAYSWTGALLNSEEDTSIVIGSEVFGIGYHSLKVWTSLPNGQIDGNFANDTAFSNLVVCDTYSGTYTLGSDTNNDFSSFTALSISLNTCGIAGAVNILVDSGTYNDQIYFNSISGASSTNTITISSASGNPNDVVLDYLATNLYDNYTIYLDSMNYVTIKNMTIKASNPSLGTAIEISNSSNNLFYGNIIQSNATNFYGICINEQNNSTYNTYRKNTIYGGNYGIYSRGTSSSNRNVGIVELNPAKAG